MSNIPPTIANIFTSLQNEIVWLHARWKIYEQLFGHSKERIDLLNECAGTCFYVMQTVLFDEIQVTLSKLTDPATSNGFENLSLEQLQRHIEKHSDAELAESLRAILDKLKKTCAVFRKRRNKQLAHLDLATALQSSTSLLPAVSHKMVNDSLELIRTYMNSIEGRYDDSETGYEHFIMHGSDGDALIALLNSALRHE